MSVFGHFTMYWLLSALLLSHPFSSRINKENVFDVIGKDKHVLVHFYADGCQHCGAFEPVWNELARMYKPLDNIETATINCDRWNSLCVMFDGTSTPCVQYFAPKQRKGELYGGEKKVLPMVKWIKRMSDVLPFTQPGALLFASPSELTELEKEHWVMIVADDPRKLAYNHTVFRSCEQERLIELRALSTSHYPKEVSELCNGEDTCVALTNGKDKFLFEGALEEERLLDFFDEHVSPEL